jgi:AdoMet-dependent heme synthase
MDTSAMKQLLRDLAGFGATAIAWSGGEPLLRTDLEELMEAGSARGLEFTLATNGYLATRKRMANLAARGLKLIQVSLDGPTSGRAARWRSGPPSAFEKAVQSARDAVSLGLTVHLCSILTPETAWEFEEMVAFARSLGVQGLRYAMWMPVGRSAGKSYDETRWEKPELGRFFHHLPMAQAKDFRVLIDCPTGPCPHREVFSCSAGNESSYITSNGDLYPCTTLMTPAYRVGNVRRVPVAELLTGAEIQKIQRELASHIPSGVCAPCPLRTSCHGGCPGRTLAAHGQFIGGAHEGAMPACLFRLHGGWKEPSPGA